MVYPAQIVDIPDLEDALTDPGLETRDWITAGAIVLGSILIAVIVRFVVRRLSSLDRVPTGIVDLLGRISGYVIIAVGFVMALGELGVNLTPVYGLILIVGVIAAVSAQDLLKDMTAGLVIQGRRPYVPGDQIVVREYAGQVVETNARVTVIDSVDGERIYVPNHLILRDDIVNLTERRARRTTLIAGLEYGTPLADARELLLAAVREADGVLDRPAPQVWIQEFNDSTIDFALRFWHAPDIESMWRVRSEVAITAKEHLDAAGMTIAFPQRTLWWG